MTLACRRDCDAGRSCWRSRRRKPAAPGGAGGQGRQRWEAVRAACCQSTCCQPVHILAPACTAGLPHTNLSPLPAWLPSALAGKGGGAEWRRALAAITNTKGQQGAAAAQPAAKHNARKAAAVPAGGDEPAAGPSSKSRQAAAKQQRQQHATGDAAASISRAAASRCVAAPSSTEPTVFNLLLCQ
jgi:hypothetical protein